MFFTVGTCSSVKVNLPIRRAPLQSCNTVLELGHAVLLQSKEKKTKNKPELPTNHWRTWC